MAEALTGALSHQSFLLGLQRSSLLSTTLEFAMTRCIKRPMALALARMFVIGASTLGACLSSSHAGVILGDPTPEGVAAGKFPGLFLVVFDPVAQVAYSKDLSINAYGDSYGSGDVSKNLFVFGQQDAGYQRIFDPLNTDPQFAKFLTASTDSSKQVWAVLAGSSNNGPGGPGAHSIYITARHKSATGVLDPDYVKLTTAFDNAGVTDATDQIGNYASVLSVEPAQGKLTPFCTSRSQTPGSCFAKLGDATYFAEKIAADGTFGTSSPSIFNSVGASSWFYRVTESSDIGDAKVTVDEFDNLTHDAFWGLGIDSNGKYILSYTLQGAIPQSQAVTTAGIARLSTVDYSARFGSSALVGLEVSAVPEPASAALWLGGLVGLAAFAQRRKLGAPKAEGQGART